MRTSRQKLALVLLIFILASPVGCGLVISGAFYELISRLPPGCGDGSTFTPADFTSTQVDLRPYWMPDYQNVRLASRDTSLQIAAFWIPADENPLDNPAVIITHGYFACRRSLASLMPAGMLHRAGISTLILDLRDVGDSDREDGRSAAGTEEFRDVLGAWDWLQTAQNIPAARIGLFGYSMGGAATINAAGAEQGIRAIWTDSAFAHLNDVMDHALRSAAWLRPLRPIAVGVGRVFSGDDLTSPSPFDQARLIGDRPFFLVHGTNDDVVPYGQLHLLVEAAEAGGTHVQSWTTDSGHVASLIDYTSEYEQRLIAFFVQTLSP